MSTAHSCSVCDSLQQKSRHDINTITKTVGMIFPVNNHQKEHLTLGGSLLRGYPTPIPVIVGCISSPASGDVTIGYLPPFMFLW